MGDGGEGREESLILVLLEPCYYPLPTSVFLFPKSCPVQLISKVEEEWGMSRLDWSIEKGTHLG